MLNNTIIASVFLAGFAGAAFADTATPVADFATSAITWDGFYVGGLVASTTATASLYDSDIWIRSVEMKGEQVGGFAGYNIQNGHFVFGGEIAYSVGPTAYEPFPAYNLDDVIDVKARGGMASGKALFYGVVGGSFGTYNRDNGSTIMETLSSQGLNYGGGVDFKVSERVFVGFEYLVRDMLSEPSTIIATETFGQKTESLQVRIGLEF